MKKGIEKEHGKLHNRVDKPARIERSIEDIKIKFKSQGLAAKQFGVNEEKPQ